MRSLPFVGRSLSTAVLLVVVGCTSGEAVVTQPDQTMGATGKALTDPRGPDVSVDSARLQASIRVLANQTVTAAEVEEGCARAQTGRTLVRFDVRTPNKGPGDLKFGHVTCRSRICGGIRCEDNPSCCGVGQSICDAPLSPEHSRFFEYSPAHGHIHFTSFADYKLLTPTGTVAAQGHKQSFCLMDLDSSPATCHDPKFDCGNQGITAGCADIYASNLACSFVDVTGVPQGEYTLEVTMDPLDAINESDETNNRTTATVRIPIGPPPPDAGTDAGVVDAGVPQLFLVRDGVGSVAEANGYYGLNVTNPAAYDFAKWQQDFIGTRPLVTALYRNKAELGFWREMHCTQTIGRGEGGCWVTNWDDAEDPTRGVPNKGTVAMNLSAAGVTRFYVFTPGGRLSPSAVLDSEGEKFVPQLCTTCHAGEYRGVAGGPDLGSIWREFEPSQLQTRPGITREEAEVEWFALNQVIKQANAAVHSEAEGAPFGTNHAKAAQAAYADEMYASTSPPVSRDVEDAFHLPPSWRTGANAVQIAAKAKIWSELVAPYCMTCHRTNSLDYSNYNQWQLVASVQGGQPLLRRYIQIDPNDPHRRQLPFMPQAKVAFELLQNDATAQIAINEWLADAANRPPVANGGPATRTVANGATVSLSAASSTDPDGDALSFQWDVVSGGPVAFSPSSTARDVSFVAPNVTQPTALIIRLTVTDPRLATASTQLTVTVNPAQGSRLEVSATDLPITIPDNNPTGIRSTINVTENKRITELKVSIDISHTFIGDLKVTLNGPGGLTKVLHGQTGRDADNLVQTYVVAEAVNRQTAGAWTLQVSDLGAADVGALRSYSLDFGIADGPPVEGRFEVAATDVPLSIPDNNSTGITSTVQVARAETLTDLKVSVVIDHTFIGDLTVTLSGGGITKVLHNKAGGSADNIVQTYTVAEAVGRSSGGAWALKVVDSAGSDVGRLRSWKLDFGVGGTPTNRAPLANAGPDLTATAGTLVNIDGTGTTDPDGDPLNFSWSRVSGPAVTLVSPTTSRPSFVAPDVTVVTNVELRLSVTDGRGGSATDTVKIAIAPRPPAGSGRVLIAEAMVNPLTTDSSREWVKIWNGTQATVDLAQFSLAFGGNATWGDTTGGAGAVLQLAGQLAPGKCLLVGGPLSDVNNAFPLFDPSATFGIGQRQAFTGFGMVNPSSTNTNAVGLFNVPASSVRGTVRPIDVLVYHSTAGTNPVSRFLGPTGALAPVNVISGSDGASGRSFRRISSTVWETSSGVSGGTSGVPPSPNNCTAIP